MTPCPLCRAEHIGSLLRPQALRDAYKAHTQGRSNAAGYAAALDAAVTEAIRMQEAVGLDVVTDGEFRRRSWFAGFVDAVDGLVHKDTQFKFIEDGEAAIMVPVPHAAGPIRRTGGIATGEFAFARAVAAKPVKITLPAPSVIHFFRGPDGIDRNVYPDEERYWHDLVAAYRAEIAALGALGCTYVQLDEVPIALLCDERIQRQVAGWGWDWRSLLERYLWAANEAMRERPAHMRFGMHLCRGNFRGHWIGAGGYEPVAEKLFNEGDADVFLLEYDTERAGDFRPLRHLPAAKSVVLGLVSTKTAALESPDLLKRRIDEASAFVDGQRLALSPQCGFGTTVGGAPLSVAEQTRKLELVARVAHEMWR
jgi:5-methyltetrahydropteroyltriglutamate--homocysteine methyltransferase